MSSSPKKLNSGFSRVTGFKNHGQKNTISEASKTSFPKFVKPEAVANSESQRRDSSKAGFLLTNAILLQRIIPPPGSTSGAWNRSRKWQSWDFTFFSLSSELQRKDLTIQQLWKFRTKIGWEHKEKNEGVSLFYSNPRFHETRFCYSEWLHLRQEPLPDTTSCHQVKWTDRAGDSG